MGQRMDFDKEIELSVPADIDLDSVMVDVEVIPASSSCLAYGLQADGQTRCVKLEGGHSQVHLPFAHRTVYLKYQGGASEVRISTIGHIDRLHSGHKTV